MSANDIATIILGSIFIIGIIILMIEGKGK